MMERNTTHEKRIVWGKPKSTLVTYYQSWIPAIPLKNLGTGACGIRGVFRREDVGTHPAWVPKESSRTGRCPRRAGAGGAFDLLRRK